MDPSDIVAILMIFSFALLGMRGCFKWASGMVVGVVMAVVKRKGWRTPVITPVAS